MLRKINNKIVIHINLLAQKSEISGL
jgi:hypothetical protein